MAFTFSPSGSFGCRSASPQEKWLVGWCPDWYLADTLKSNMINVEEVHEQLLSRHGSWKHPVIRDIIASMSTDRIYRLWTTPEVLY